MSSKTKHEEVWMSKYQLVKNYKEKYGDIYIPYKYVSEGIAIGSWLSTQRNAYKKKQSCMTPKRIKLLEELGIDWDNTNNPNFINSKEKHKEFLSSAKKYYSKFHNLDIPNDYVDSSGIALGNWINSIRKTYSNIDLNLLLYNPKEVLKYENRLSVDNIIELNRMSMIWKNDDNNDWDYKYQLAKKYFEQNGNLLIPTSYNANDENKTNLGAWISYQRQLFNNEKGLSKDKVVKLEMIGMIWNPREEQWEQKYLMAKEYFEQNGNLKIPKNYVVGECNLGKWILWQRQAKRGNVRNSLSKEKIEKLDNIGMIWETSK